ncbi:MAG: sulfite exporter TauE/SafE family protein [Deltaproteobacteria bacterium]|nr:sulfite exporter TauE/SafE family protein [Deltaproteobacteria bacterium]
MDISLHTLAILGVVFLSILVRSTFGFGEALIAMPLLAFIIDLKTAAPFVAIIAGTVTFIILVTNWHRVQFHSAWRLVVASFAGIPLGLLFLKGTYDVTMKVALAIVIIVFSIYSLLSPRLWVLKNEKYAYGFGFIAGILGGAYNTAGPPIVIYGTMRQWDPGAFRATLQGYFLPTWLFIMIGHGVSGLWSSSIWQLYLVSLPVLLVAYLIGNRLNRSIPAKSFHQYIHIILIGIGIFLFFRTVWGT